VQSTLLPLWDRILRSFVLWESRDLIAAVFEHAHFGLALDLVAVCLLLVGIDHSVIAAT